MGWGVAGAAAVACAQSKRGRDKVSGSQVGRRKTRSDDAPSSWLLGATTFLILSRKAGIVWQGELA